MNLVIIVINVFSRQPVSQGIGHEKDEKTRKGHKQPIFIWPEWSEQDIAAEKWVRKTMFLLSR